MRFIKPVSRRSVIIHGIVLGAAFVWGFVPGRVGFAQSPTADKVEKKEKVTQKEQTECGKFVSFQDGELTIKANSGALITNKITESTKVSGKFFRVWMDVKAAITGKDRKAILGSCEYGENIADETYQHVQLSHLKSEQQTMINAQHALLKADFHLVKSMHDALVSN